MRRLLAVVLLLVLPASAHALDTSVAEDGTAAVAWPQGDTVRVAVGRPGALAAPVTLDTDASVQHAWVIAEPGGTARVVWQTYAAKWTRPVPPSFGWAVEAARVDAGGAIGAPETVTTEVPRDGEVAVASNSGGDVLVTWTGGRGQPDVGGVTWAASGGPVQELGVVPPRFARPAVADSGAALIAGVDAQDVPVILERPAGALFGPAVPVDGGGLGAGVVAADLASDGTAVLGLATADGGGFSLLRGPGGGWRRVTSARAEHVAAVAGGRALLVADSATDVAADGTLTTSGTFGGAAYDLAATEDGAASVGLAGPRVAERDAVGPFDAVRALGQGDEFAPTRIAAVARSAGGSLAAGYGDGQLRANGQTLSTYDVPPRSSPPGVVRSSRLTVLRGPLHTAGGVARVPVLCTSFCTGRVHAAGERPAKVSLGNGDGAYLRLPVGNRRRVRIVIALRGARVRVVHRRTTRRPAPRTCGAPWGRTVAAGGHTRLRLAVVGDEYGDETYRFVACGPDGRARRIHTESVTEMEALFLGPYAVNRNYAFVAHSVIDHYGNGYASILRVDLRTGARQETSVFDTYLLGLDRLLVDDAGRLLFSDEVFGRRRVLARDGAGHRVLDPGPGVDPTSLTLRDGVAAWTRDGEPQSVSLTP